MEPIKPIEPVKAEMASIRIGDWTTRITKSMLYKRLNCAIHYKDEEIARGFYTARTLNAAVTKSVQAMKWQEEKRQLLDATEK